VSGDTVFAAAFVSYASPFSSGLRKDLYQSWSTDLGSREIPMTEGVNLVQLVASDNVVEEWHAKVMVSYICMMCVVPLSTISISCCVHFSCCTTSFHVYFSVYIYICMCMYIYMRVFTCLLTSLSCSLKGLPKDRMSTENGAIVHASLRWPLFIDPQLQGLNWIRNMESSSSSSPSSSITVISSATPHWIKLLNKCVTNGTTCVIEGLNGSIDPILLPLVSKNVIRKGRSLFVTVGSEEVLYDSQFKLFLHTQSSNPHFSPEVAAQCAIIDFTVTQVYL
jgi:hypothetical protein